MKNKVKCNNCQFNGNESALKLKRDGQEFIKVCPNCKTDSYLIDVKPTQNKITNLRNQIKQEVSNSTMDLINQLVNAEIELEKECNQ